MLRCWLPILCVAVLVAGCGSSSGSDEASSDATATAALFALVRQVTPDKVLPRISQYGGKVLQSSLSNDSEQRLQEALNAAAHA